MVPIKISEFSAGAFLKQLDGTLVSKLIKKILKLDKIDEGYAQINEKNGAEFVSAVLQQLNIKYEVAEEDLKKIPKEGPFITISNHPFGGVDGLILLDILAKHRPDFKVLANFLLSRIAPLEDSFIAVDPFQGDLQKTANISSMRKAIKHLEEGKPLGVFPAGEVSTYQLEYNTVADKKWQKSILKLIKKASCPVIPIYFHGANSWTFHVLGSFHPLLRTVQLPSELLNKSDKTFGVRVGKPIPLEDIARFDKTEHLGTFLRAKTYSLGTSLQVKNFFPQFRTEPFNTSSEDIIEPMKSEVVNAEVSRLMEHRLLFAYNEFKVFFAPAIEIPALIHEIGRMREITFREVGEGTNRSIDLDIFDNYYHHLIVWDEVAKKLVGAYRIGKGKDIVALYGKKGFYLSTLFKIKKGFLPIMQESMEMGRSFVVKEYQRKPLSLFLLWKGIFYVLLNNPEYRYLIGPVSISNYFSEFSKTVIVNFIKTNFFDSAQSKFIKPKKKFKLKLDKKVDLGIISNEIKDSFNKLDSLIDDMQPTFKAPVLLKKYIGLNAKIIGFNIDPDFNNCLDGLLMLDIYKIPKDKLKALAKELGDETILRRFSEEVDEYIAS